MKCRQLVRYSRNASLVLFAGLILSAPLFGYATSASASDSPVGLSKITDLLSRVKIASTNTRNLEVLAIRRQGAVKMKAEHDLQIAVGAQKKLTEDFRVAINSALAESPGSVKLLRAFAIAFNARAVAEESLARADLKLKADQEIIQYLQKALKAVVTGGQSDMNSELGSMRLKLYQASNRISGDKGDVALVSSELALAITDLSQAISKAHADPVASMAVDAQTDIYAHSTRAKRIQENPIAWNWAFN